VGIELSARLKVAHHAIPDGNMLRVYDYGIGMGSGGYIDYGKFDEK